MASKVEITIKLPSADEAERLMSDEFFTRYIKDGFSVREVAGTYYDTAFGELAAQNCKLRVQRVGRVFVAELTIGASNEDGVFRGQQWTCRFVDAHSVMERLHERGAPEFELTSPLELAGTFRYTSTTAILYMPDQIRVELAFNVSDDETTLVLDLLYGATAELLHLAESVLGSR